MKKRKILYIISSFVFFAIFYGGINLAADFTSFVPAKAVIEYSVIKYSIVNLLKILRVVQILLPVFLIIFSLILVKNKKKKILNILIAIILFFGLIFIGKFIFNNNIKKVTLDVNEISSYNIFKYDNNTVYYIKNK